MLTIGPFCFSKLFSLYVHDAGFSLFVKYMIIFFVKKISLKFYIILHMFIIGFSMFVQDMTFLRISSYRRRPLSGKTGGEGEKGERALKKIAESASRRRRSFLFAARRRRTASGGGTSRSEEPEERRPPSPRLVGAQKVSGRRSTTM